MNHVKLKESICGTSVIKEKIKSKGEGWKGEEAVRVDRVWRAVEEGRCGMIMRQRLQEVDRRNLMKEEC